MPKIESPDPIDVGVGLRLRALREDRGLTQTALSSAMGVTYQQIQKYERGLNRISASMLVRAARALGVGAAALLPDEDGPKPTGSSVLRILVSVRGAEELVETAARIKSSRVRNQLLKLCRTLAAEGAGSDDEEQ